LSARIAVVRHFFASLVSPIFFVDERIAYLCRVYRGFLLFHYIMPIRKIGVIADNIMFAVWENNKEKAFKLLMELIETTMDVLKHMK
jgi:hypothetical protein